MIARPGERRSRLAAASSRLAALSIPVLVIAAIGHRSGQLGASATYAAMALGFLLAALAAIAAIAAFAVIWRDGRKGFGAAARGLVVALLVLTIPAIGAWKVVTYPRLIDVTTDVDDPPLFDKAQLDRAPDDEPIAEASDAEIAAQQDAYPDIISRHYPVSPARVFEAASGIVGNRGWRVLDSREPTDADETGRIEAVAMTLLFAFRQDVVIRIVPDGDGALIDMRSAARNGAHDLGADAERIRDFLAELDSTLQGVTKTTGQ
jgi:hypothetical protein